MIRLTDDYKDKVIDKMMSNLVPLRTMLHLTQEQIAQLIGVTRQTIVAFETGKRRMTWGTYLSFLFLFYSNSSTRSLLEIMEIYPKELNEFFSGLDSMR